MVDSVFDLRSTTAHEKVETLPPLGGCQELFPQFGQPVRKRTGAEADQTMTAFFADQHTSHRVLLLKFQEAGL